MYWVWLLMAIALFVANWFALRDRPGCLLALQLSFSSQRFSGLLADLKGTTQGEAWLDRYRRWLKRDYLTLICYGAFGWLFATQHLNPAGFPGWVPGWAIEVLPWLLPVAAASDALENALHLHLTDLPVAWAPDWLYPVSGLAATLKWLLILAFVGLVIVGS